MSKMYDTINLDWDGVLWNFKQAFCDWFGHAGPDSDKWEFYEEFGMTASKFHELLSGLPQEFWEQEKYILPHAHKLVDWARANAEKVCVLTVAPEWTTARGKRNLARSHFDLVVYTVAKAEEKVEFAGFSEVERASLCDLLIDDKPSSVVRFANESSLSGGYIWPAEYNEGLDPSWYFDLSWLEEPTVDSKPVLDYDAMDEAKKRKMTPMYSGLLAYFPDALALVARNSMVGHYQHNDHNDPMYWDRSKSADEMDAMIRHMADHSKNPRDKDGTLHMSKVAWRALAFVQKFIEEEQNEQG